MSDSIKNVKNVIAEIERFGKVSVPAGVLEFQKTLVKELHRLILTKTPIDKGVLRGNWNLAINSSDEPYDPKKKTSANFTGMSLTGEERSDLEKILLELDSVGIGNTVHLYNGTPYALKAEQDGWSPSSPPYMMVALSLIEIKTAIGAAKKEFESTVASLQQSVGISYAANV